MSAEFDRAFQILLGHEGGWVDDPNDNGGETKYGISKRSYPSLDIKSLTVEKAKSIYHTDFWWRCRCQEMPWPVALVVFDSAVHAGPPRAVRWVQEAVKATADGIPGPMTLMKIKAAANPVDVAVDVLARRQVYLAGLDDWRHYGLGWSRRLMKLAMQAVGG